MLELEVPPLKVPLLELATMQVNDTAGLVTGRLY